MAGIAPQLQPYERLAALREDDYEAARYPDLAHSAHLFHY
jgi:hypothetical protein